MQLTLPWPITIDTFKSDGEINISSGSFCLNIAAVVEFAPKSMKLDKLMTYCIGQED